MALAYNVLTLQIGQISLIRVQVVDSLVLSTFQQVSVPMGLCFKTSNILLGPATVFLSKTAANVVNKQMLGIWNVKFQYKSF